MSGENPPSPRRRPPPQCSLFVHGHLTRTTSCLSPLRPALLTLRPIEEEVAGRVRELTAPGAAQVEVLAGRRGSERENDRPQTRRHDQAEGADHDFGGGRIQTFEVARYDGDGGQEIDDRGDRAEQPAPLPRQPVAHQETPENQAADHEGANELAQRAGKLIALGYRQRYPSQRQLQNEKNAQRRNCEHHAWRHRHRTLAPLGALATVLEPVVLVPIVTLSPSTLIAFPIWSFPIWSFPIWAVPVWSFPIWSFPIWSFPIWAVPVFIARVAFRRVAPASRSFLVLRCVLLVPPRPPPRAFGVARVRSLGFGNFRFDDIALDDLSDGRLVGRRRYHRLTFP